MRFPELKFSYILLFLIISYTYAFSHKVNVLDYEFSSGKEKDVRKLLREVVMDTATFRPKTTNFIDSKSGFFRIHYNVEGLNAVSLTDLNNNQIPDYIDSVLYYCDYVHDFYTKELGYRDFAQDTGGGGSKAYDVYIWDLGNYDSQEHGGVYGFSYPTDGDILPHREFDRYHTFTMIDNNFSPNDTMKTNSGKYYRAYYTTGYNALKITIAHEFHHAVQSIYGLAPIAQTTFMEMTSTFYEYRLFPEITDYLQYANLLMKNPENMPLGVDNLFNGYCYSLLFQCLYAKFGDNAIKDIWDLAYAGMPYFYGLDSTIRKNGSTMKQFWGEFVDWLYYTGQRAKTDYGFDKASLIDTMKIFRALNYSEPETGESYLMLPFEFRCYRYNFPKSNIKTDDTLDVVLSNCDLAGASLNSGLSKEYWISLSNFPKSNTKVKDTINGSEVYFNFNSEDDLIIFNFYPHLGTEINRISNPFPNPLYLNEESSLYFPVSKTEKYGDAVLLTVYTTDMVPIFSKETTVSVRNSYLVVNWDMIPEDLSSGVYIFSVQGLKTNSERTLGKFAISRK